ncbi:uncharacterized protein LOC132060979 [Lycium ferocissimum]|uniref:uncharacterized protein LOC132060979 n=1 Tax=Lycium ferocissimum TaxID=112874 RepID=UPI002814B81D|nr:uncharacterized protein LOC132060979 [Lycium ferocissimum]
MDNWAVDLEKRTCSCRKWSLTGIPCKHAIAAIWAKKDNIIDYVHDCYKVEIYRKIYENSILPMNGPQMWPKSSKVPPLPPRITRKKKKGRKQTLRRKEQDEVGASRTKMKRKQKSLDCSKCHKPGHNIRTCKYIVPPETTSSVRQKLHVRRRCDEEGQEAMEHEQMRQQEVEIGPDFIWENSQYTQQNGPTF